jgi:MFS family permease
MVSPEPSSRFLSRSTLRHETFRAIWIAAIFSYVGNWLQDIGESWLMLSLTSHAVLIAMVTTSASIPAFMLMMPAGVLSDRFDRRSILVVSQGALVVVAAVLAATTALGVVSPAIILFSSACLGAGSAISTPAWQTLVPELVPRAEMPEAVTLNSVAFNIARAVGPAIGGLILSLAGPAATFGLNALSFLGVIYALQVYPDVRRVATRPRSRSAGEPFHRALLGVFSYARKSKSLRALYVAVAVFAVSAATIPALLPLFAKETLGTSARGYGLLLGALGAGAVLAALVLRRVRSVVSARALIATSFALYGISTFAATFAPSIGVAVVLLVPAGVGWLSSLTTLNALVQLSSPRWIKARAMALYQLSFLLFWSIGATVGGAFAMRVGTPSTMRLAALATIGAAVAVTRLAIPSYTEDAESVPTPAPVSVR